MFHHRMTINLLDYFAPVATFLSFVLLVFLICFLFVNFWLITDKDDLTVFEKFGARHFGIRLGPHSLAQIRERMPTPNIKHGTSSAGRCAVGQWHTAQKEQQQKKGQNGEKRSANKSEQIEMGVQQQKRGSDANN